jgi:hypothetical protein
MLMCLCALHTFLADQSTAEHGPPPKTVTYLSVLVTMRKGDVYLPALAWLGGPLRTETLLVLRGGHAILNAMDQRPCG